MAVETAREIPPSALALLVQDIHKDEVRWCGMLMRTINVLEGTPSSATGAFWGKAIRSAGKLFADLIEHMDVEDQVLFERFGRSGRAGLR